MPLPFSREETAGPAGKIKSNTTNAIQDAIRARHNRQIHFGHHGWASGGTLNSQINQSAMGQAAAGLYTTYLSLTPWLIPGDTIKDLTWRWFNGVTPTVGTIDLLLYRRGLAGGAVTNISATVGDTNTGGASAERTSIVAPGHVVLADNFYVCRVIVDATGANDGAGFRGVTLTLGV